MSDTGLRYHARGMGPLIARMRARRPTPAEPPVPPRHWASLAERGLYGGLWALALAYRLLGRRGCMAFMAPVVLYFFLTGTVQRRASRAFLTRAFAVNGWGAPTVLAGLRHFMTFAARALDTFAAWTGALRPESVVAEDAEALRAAAEDPRGALFIVAHHGNAELSRALLDPGTRERLTVLVHTRHAENYNRVLREFSPEAAVNTFQVTELGPETAIALKERVERGAWVVIAGDRTPVSGQGRVSLVPFLGRPAPFSQGPYILASLLECPVYLLFCRREGERHRLCFEKLAERVELPRGRREEALDAYAAAFAKRLERQALADPYQWFNFFDFWARPQGQETR